VDVLTYRSAIAYPLLCFGEVKMNIARHLVIVKRCRWKNHLIMLLVIYLQLTISSHLYSENNALIFKDQQVESIVSATREALGGTNNIANIKSFLAKGRIIITPVIGNPSPQNIEIRVLLPDNAIRIISSSSEARYQGVSGNNLANEILVNGKPAADVKYPATQLSVERARFTRLLLGMFMLPGPSTSLSIAMSKDKITNKNNSLLVASGTSGVLCSIEIDSKSKYPFILRYKSKAMMPRAEPIIGMGSGSFSLPKMEDVEMTMYFGDRVLVNGIMFPKSIITKVRNTMIEEIRLENIILNANLQKRNFQISNGE
jgi:hypothetical protein